MGIWSLIRSVSVSCGLLRGTQARLHCLAVKYAINREFSSRELNSADRASGTDLYSTAHIAVVPEAPGFCATA